MSLTKPRVLLVGGGLTSSVIASLLSEKNPNISLKVWDKASRPGGRMTSHRSKDKLGQVDLGAQYITATSCYQKSHAKFYDELLQAGLLRPLTSMNKTQLLEVKERQEIGEYSETKNEIKKGISISLDDKFWEEPENESDPINLVRSTNFVTPKGVESIVNYFWNKSGCEVNSFHTLKELNLVDRTWKANTDKKQEEFDCVVTTMPVPQLLGENPAPEGMVQGNFLDIIKKDRLLYENLSCVKYNSIFCLGLFYDTRIHDSLGLKWKAKYFPNDPVIRYISMDNLKRGDLKSPTCVGVQTQVSYSMANKHKSKQEMLEPILDHLQKLLPNLPPPSHSFCHKWRYSQTSQPYPGEPGCVQLHSSPTLIAAGDSFSHSNVDGCIASALAATDMILRNIEQSV